MNTQRDVSAVWLILAFLILVIGLIMMPLSRAIAQEPPPERPDPPSERPNPPSGRPQPPASGSEPEVTSTEGEDRGDDAPTEPCFTVYGVVTNWGYGPEPRIPVVLSGSDWQTHKLTDDNGRYASDCMGSGIGLVNLQLPPELKPLTTDVAIRLGYKPNFEVNLGLYGGEVTPPLDTPLMTVSQTEAAPGQTLIYNIQVTNNQENNQSLEEVIVTDLLPDTLTPVTISSNIGQQELWGNLASVDIGELAPDQTATITITTTVNDKALAANIITNQASLIYKDHIVVQTAPVIVTVAPHTADYSNEAGQDLDEPPNTLPLTGAAQP